VLKKLLADNPEHVGAMLLLGRAFLHDNKLEAAEDAFKKAIFLKPEHEERFSYYLAHISFIRDTKNMEKVLDLHTNTRRWERGEFSQHVFKLQNQLHVKPQNQFGFFVYPVSDSVVFIANASDFIKDSTIFSRQGKPVRIYSRQASLSHIRSLRDWWFWIEDSLILRAKELLAEDLPQDALSAFTKAYEENPEHYYLANYIQHLQLVTSPEYETLKSVLQAYAGPYEDVKLEMQDDHFYLRDYRGWLFELLPLSEDTFMVPSIYELTIHMVKENNVVSGLKYLYRDGREEFYPRTHKEALAQSVN
jgi:tetratricopeptide (TPR) repeat protein